jgi:vacuolar iron transporter family protein
VPILATILAPTGLLSPVIAASTLVTLATLGATAASAGGASIWRGAVRVTFWGALAMAVTAGVGRLFGAAV